VNTETVIKMVGDFFDLTAEDFTPKQLAVITEAATEIEERLARYGEMTTFEKNIMMHGAMGAVVDYASGCTPLAEFIYDDARLEGAMIAGIYAGKTTAQLANEAGITLAKASRILGSLDF
jgi:hypothetical protein